MGRCFIINEKVTVQQICALAALTVINRLCIRRKLQGRFLQACNEQLRKMIPLQELMESVCEIYPK